MIVTRYSHHRLYFRDPSAFIGAIFAQVALSVLVIIAYLRNYVENRETLAL
jgi:hypothetical protein